MEISRFKEGDKVWFVGVRKDKKIWDIAEVTIEEIFVSGNNDLFVIINFGKDKGTMIHLARNCFATKEEAQKECDKRNGKI
jgi:hypothetical protein